MSKKTDLFGDETSSGENDFAALFDQSLKGADRKLKAGDSFKGEILSIGKEEAFVSTGTPVDGALPVRELLDDKKELKFKVGDIIDVKVVRVREGEVLLHRAGSGMASDEMDNLEDAFDMELPVEGKVTEAVKGGFRVQVAGKMAFCPVSQIDLRGPKDGEEYIGKKFEFLVTQFEPRNIVVSRRRHLENRRLESEGEFMSRHEEGALLNGTITRLERFGAFCELEDGVEGLIPISELAWNRIGSPAEIVSVGQKVTVALLRVTEEGNRLKISLSLKQAGGEGDPWNKVPTLYPVGSLHEGTVERKEPYGLFVNLGPGVTGLLPKSKWRDTLDAQSFENRKKGDKVKVQVDQIQIEEKRLSLAPAGEAADDSWRAHTAAGSSGGKGLGTMADLLKGFKPGR